MVLTDLRCQTDDVSASSLARTAVASAMERAASLGHVLDVELEPVRVSKSQTGSLIRCSCGWSCNPQSKKARAFRYGFEHLGEVLGEDVLGPIVPADSRRGRRPSPSAQPT